MRMRFIKHVVGVAFLVFGLGLPQFSRATLVDAGWDLFLTDPGSTTFLGQHFEGVPLGTFDFGGSIGVKPVGNTDTIMQRLAAGPGTGIPIALQAFELQSVNPFDPDGSGDAPLATYYVTLQSLHGGLASGGTVDIAENQAGTGGTFQSFFDVWFDVRAGGLNGDIVMSGTKHFTGSGIWSHDAPAGALEIPGVNYLLDGADTAQDFWPVGLTIHDAGDGTHGVTPVPEPSTVIGGALLLLPFGASTLRLLRRRTA